MKNKIFIFVFVLTCSCLAIIQYDNIINSRPCSSDIFIDINKNELNNNIVFSQILFEKKINSVKVNCKYKIVIKSWDNYGYNDFVITPDNMMEIVFEERSDSLFCLDSLTQKNFFILNSKSNTLSSGTIPIDITGHKHKDFSKKNIERHQLPFVVRDIFVDSLGDKIYKICICDYPYYYDMPRNDFIVYFSVKKSVVGGYLSNKIPLDTGIPSDLIYSHFGRVFVDFDSIRKQFDGVRYIEFPFMDKAIYSVAQHE